MTDPITDEAVQAAAWQLALELGHTTMGMGKAAPNTFRIARAALTAAAPLILAERDEQLRELVDRWAGKASGDDFTHSERITWRKCADALDALLREGE